MKEVPFDLGTEEKLPEGCDRNSKEDDQGYVSFHGIIAISTQTDNDRGDLFAGQEGNKSMIVDIQEVRCV